MVAIRWKYEGIKYSRATHPRQHNKRPVETSKCIADVFELAILGQKFVFWKRRETAIAAERNSDPRSANAAKRVLFMAEDVSSVVAWRFRNATEPITEISLNVDGGARMQKEKAIPAFTRATPFVKYPLEVVLYGSPPTECEVNYTGT